MKNSKSVFMGMLALALTVGLVLAGCKSPVEVDVGGVGKAKKVAAAATSNNRYYVVTWEAGADAGKVEYEVVVAEVVNKKLVEAGTIGFAQNSEVYDTTTGLASPNSDYSKWSALISGFSSLKAGTYKAGVRTTDVLDNSNKTGTIAWAQETFTLTAEAAPAGTLTLTPHGNAKIGVANATVDFYFTLPAVPADHAYSGAISNSYPNFIMLDGAQYTGTEFNAVVAGGISQVGASGATNSGNTYNGISVAKAGVYSFHVVWTDTDNTPSNLTAGIYNVFEVPNRGTWYTVTVVD